MIWVFRITLDVVIVEHHEKKTYCKSLQNKKKILILYLSSKNNCLTIILK